MVQRSILIIMLMTMITGIGCSSGTPIEPETDIIPETSNQFLPYFIPESEAGGIRAGQGLMGVFDLYVDRNELQAEITPMRSAGTVGDSFLTNMISYFTTAPCVNCLRITKVSLDVENHVTISFETSHPFGPADQTEPPTARNRDDLRIFDVKLIVVAEGEDTFPMSGIKLKSGLVSNADGYTNIENKIIERKYGYKSNAYPYIILAKDATTGNVNASSETGFTDLLNATGHNVLNQGKTYNNDLKLYLPYGEGVNLSLALFGSYGQSVENFQYRFEPRYYLPEFNIKEPWKVDVEIVEDGLNDSSAASLSKIRVKVWDWQHSNTNIDPLLGTLNSIKAESSVTEVSVEIPGVNQPINKVTTASSGTGIGNDPLVFNVEIKNDKMASPGKYKGLVKVLDNRQHGHNWGSLGDLVDYETGGELDFIRVDEFATYQTFTINVADAGGPLCGPISCRVQYRIEGLMPRWENLSGTVLNFLNGEARRVRVIPESPNATITGIKYEFDDPRFEDQTSGVDWIERTYDNPNCSLHDPFELNMKVTVSDDCDASADWVENITVKIHCHEACGPLVQGNISYSLNGGDYLPLPAGGIDIEHNDVLAMRATGFNSDNAQIGSYTWDFHDSWIEDQASTSSQITRTIPHPTCTLAGDEVYHVKVDLIVSDTCPTTNDMRLTRTIRVGCPAACGPIGDGQLRYSLNQSPFVNVPGNRLTVRNNDNIELELFDFSSPNASIEQYSFIFDNFLYENQIGTDNSIERTFTNSNCVGGTGDPQYVRMIYGISDDCSTSLDYTGELEIQIICSSCFGTGISFNSPSRLLGSSSVYNNMDITKVDGGGTKLSETSGATVLSGFSGNRISDSSPGIALRASMDNGSSWPDVFHQFITTPSIPGGFSIISANAAQTVVVPWFDPTDRRLYIERSTNSGVSFSRTEIYRGNNPITSVTSAKDPRDSSKMYVVILEDDNASRTSNTIKLFSSTDAGETFGMAQTAFSSTGAYGRLFGVVDMVVSPVNSNLYIAATQNGSDGSNIFVARSNNFGVDFMAGARVLSNNYGQTIDTLDIAATKSDPSGQSVYVAFTQGSVSTGSVKMIKGNVLMDSFKVLDVKISDVTNRRPKEAEVAADREGNVYVIWRDDRASAGNPDIYADFSRDGGRTFTNDIIVNDTSPGTSSTTSPELVISGSNCEFIVIYEDNGQIFARVG